MPACNTEAMNLHLAEVAATVAPAAHAILLVDQAGWHLSTRLLVPANITIILVHYRGGGPAMQDIVAGHIEGMFIRATGQRYATHLCR
jgi:tripartite-type tricarboxylate transporter receptor subunit TctC